MNSQDNIQEAVQTVQVIDNTNGIVLYRQYDSTRTKTMLIKTCSDPTVSNLNMLKHEYHVLASIRKLNHESSRTSAHPSQVQQQQQGDGGNQLHSNGRDHIVRVIRLSTALSNADSLDSLGSSTEDIPSFEGRSNLFLFLEDFGGVPLYDIFLSRNRSSSDVLTKHFNIGLGPFIRIIFQLSLAIDTIHGSSLLHRGICPSAIHVVAKSGFNGNNEYSVQIVDFSTAIYLDKGSYIAGSYLNSKDMRYISPEQTGRMNRMVDYRSDFYSLGTLLYELLTGYLPLEGKDVMDLIHLLIAKRPVPAHIRNQKVPACLSVILSKLLEKSPALRYQSARGLRNDLLDVLAQIKTHALKTQHYICANLSSAQNVVETRDIRFLCTLDDDEIIHSLKAYKNFIPGQCDPALNTLLLSEKMYGRHSQTQIMKDAFFYSIQNEKISYVVVKGQGGCGKTRLINELQPLVVEYHGLWCYSKFDLTNKDTAYYCLFYGLRKLYHDLVNSSEAVLSKIRDNLRESMNPHGIHLLKNLSADLTLFYGPLPIVSPNWHMNMTAQQIQQLQHQSWEIFLRTLTSFGPLVFVLDDMQWADMATINFLVQSAKKLPDMPVVFVISFREQELESNSLIFDLLHDSKSKSVPVFEIEIGNLRMADVTAMLSDSLHVDAKELGELAKYVFKVTEGNPFHIYTFLKEMYYRNILRVTIEAKTGFQTWSWSMEEILAANMSTSVIELMAQQLQTRLPLETQEILKIAAAIGHSFDLQTLSKLVDDSVSTVAKNLWPAVEQGYIVTQGDHHRYLIQGQQVNNPDSQIVGLTSPIIDKFVHDRVQNAAYELVPEEMRPKIHLKIARVLLSSTKSDDITSKLFVILQHYEKGLNKALDELNDHEQSDALNFADLCYQAALRAKKTSSFQLASKYAKIAFKILTYGKGVDAAWNENYTLMLELSKIKTFVLGGLGDVQNCQKYFDSIRKHGKTVTDKLCSSYSEFSGGMASFQYEKCMSQSIGDAAMFGYEVPSTEKAAQDALKSLLNGRSFESILVDIEKVLEGEPWPLVEDETLNTELLCVRHVMTICYILLKLDTCIWASLIYIERLINEAKFHQFLPEAILYFGISIPTKDVTNRRRIYKIWSTLVQKYELRYPEFKSHSHFFCAVFCWNTLSFQEMDDLLSESINRALERADISIFTYSFIAYWFFKYERSMSVIETIKLGQRYGHVFEAMNGPSTVVYRALIKHFQQMADPTDDIAVPRIDVHPALISMVSVPAIVCAVMFADFEMLGQLRKNQEQYPPIQSNRFIWAWSSMIADDPSLSCEDKIKELDKIGSIQEALVELNKETEFHKLQLTYAERERVRGNEEQMMVHYEKCIEQCKKYDLLFQEALANERMGKYWFQKGASYRKVAGLFFQEAGRIYTKWGCLQKLKQLEREYKDIIPSTQYKKVHAVRSVAKKDEPNIVAGSSQDLSPSFDERPLSRASTPLSANMRKSSAISKVLSISTSSSGSVAKSKTDECLSPATPVGHVDVATLLKATQMIANESNLESIIRALIFHTAYNVGATDALIVLKNDQGQFLVEATFDGTVVKAMQAQPLYSGSTDDFSPVLPLSILDSVSKSGSALIIEDALSEPTFKYDLYVSTKLPKSILCVPIKQKNVVIGVLYLENNLMTGAFTEERLEIVTSLTAAAAISIENSRLLQVNSELRVQLHSHSATKDVSDMDENAAPKYIVDGPIKSALDSLNEIMRNFPSLGDQLRKVEDILILGQNAFASNIDSIQDETGKGIDDDTKDWLKVTIQLDDASSTLSRDMQSASGGRLRRNRKSTMSFTSSLPAETREIDDELKTILYTFNKPEFNVFDLEKATNGAPLGLLGPFIVNEGLQLSGKLGLNPQKVERFFRALEVSYRNVPYHNSSHGADVMQTTYMLISSDPTVYSNFSSLEIFAAILSGAAHDADHPGLNNTFLIQTRDRLAVLYSDQSVLEYHHSATAFTVAMANEEDNIFRDLSTEKFRDLRKIVVQMILATDMAKHFEYVNRFKARIAMKTQAAVGPSGSTISPQIPKGLKELDDPADRQLVLEIAIKCADLSNPAKATDVAVRWTDAIMKEFFNQGDLESARGLPVSKFMDRSDPNVPKCQLGFIDVLVSPLFEAWRLGVGSNPYCDECHENIVNNRKFWDNLFTNQRLTIDDALLAVKIQGEPTSAKIIDQQEDAYPQDNKKSKRFAI